MDLSHSVGAVASVAGLFSLPLAIPGYMAVFSEPVRNFMVRRRWIPYVLLIAICAGYFFDLAARFNLYGAQPAALQNDYNKVFEGKVVFLDGHAFYDCIFRNVIFHWDGGKSFMRNPTITGARGFQTSDDKIMLAVDLFKTLHLLDPQFALSWTHEQGGHWE